MEEEAEKRREDEDAEASAEDGDKRKWMSTAQLWVDSHDSDADSEVTYVGTKQSALNCGTHVERMYEVSNINKCSFRYILESSSFELFFEYVGLPNFDIASDAPNTFKDSSENIRIRVFHVFKVFVANPDKPRSIIEVLLDNRRELLKLLHNLPTSKGEDKLDEEGDLIIKEIEKLACSSA